MNLEITISIIAITFGIASLGFSRICYNNSRRQRELLDFLAKQNANLINN